MSILVKPYTISVWEDVWEPNEQKFVEKRLGVIGSDKMTTPGRVLEPMLTRNVNGSKKFTFKMYKKYIDAITGQEVDNPFAKWLVSERKVKLKYGTYIDSDGQEKPCWHDFIIKDIAENSSNYLYTYSLEDALVQELSKNGFGVTLDAALMNNIGSAKELAEFVLNETDWNIESETFVQTVEEGLVYIQLPSRFPVEHQVTIYRLKDQAAPYTSGVESEVDSTPLGKTVLAFYSCCKNQPHRFQFIYLPQQEATDGSPYDKNKVHIDEKGTIDEKDCQYYFDADNLKYELIDGFYLPMGCKVITEPGAVDSYGVHDTTISCWYRGNRYGFAQSAQYVPLLDRYCYQYKSEEADYYGYMDNEYTSPATLLNVITNADFKGTSGWVGSYVGPIGNIKSTVGAQVESVYGRFGNDGFSSVIDELANGTFNNANVNDYASYLKVTFPAAVSGNYPVLLNTGFYDNRRAINNVCNGEKWQLDYQIYDSKGTAYTNGLTFTLQEIDYNVSKNNHNLYEEHSNKTWGTASDNILTITHEDIAKNDFLNKDIKLLIAPNTTDKVVTIYIKQIALYRLVKDKNNKVIKPGDVDVEGITKTKYYFFSKSDLETAQKAQDKDKLVLIPADVINYSIYKPVYNTGAEKVRSITAHESNYFNILQSIAETFGCWLSLRVDRDIKGGITSKTVCLKNYLGKDNYASFRYGVNLKDVQRTYASRNIVTKLMVKQNSNEHAQDGFCTIARAGSNNTGESYIYDFSYFHNAGLLDASAYISEMYYSKNPLQEDVVEKGPDLGKGHEKEQYNLQNYCNRIKNINEQLEPIAKKLVDLQTDLITYNAELVVQENARDAANSSLEENANDFLALTGLYPTQISPGSIKQVTCTVPAATDEFVGSNELNDENWAKDAVITSTQKGAEDSLTWHFDVALPGTKTAIDTDFDTEGLLFAPGKHALTCYRDNPSQYLFFRPAEGFQKGSRYIGTITLQPTEASNLFLKLSSLFSDTELKVNGIKQDTGIYVSDVACAEYTIEIAGTCSEVNQKFGLHILLPASASLPPVTFATSDEQLYIYKNDMPDSDRSFYFRPRFTITTIDDTSTTTEKELSCTIPAGSLCGELDFSLAVVDITAQAVSNLLTEYATYNGAYQNALAKIGSEVDKTGLKYQIANQTTKIQTAQETYDALKEHKEQLNKLFYTKYCRFIQEGTWIGEEYIDDDKYYADAQSVMYNSCYPKVAYTINVLSLAGLPGYEDFDFDIGDITYAEDPEFFGEEQRVQVSITEMTEYLDSPNKNTIKVQSFKDQFQDLFQKITATTQQVQYSTGAYKKAVALAEADIAIKGKFVTDGLNAADEVLQVAGQTDVQQGKDGITLTDSGTNNQLRLIGGAIMMSQFDQQTGKRVWKTALTPSGISASLITAGTLNAGAISIMNANEPAFRWDAYGLSAFDAQWDLTSNSITKINPRKFVRYDKYGIYGIDFPEGDNGFNGTTWKPKSNDDIDKYATFALTWNGLKVTGNNNTVARIGRLDNYIIKVTREEEEKEASLMSLSTSGEFKLGGWTVNADGLQTSSGQQSSIGRTNYLTKISAYKGPDQPTIQSGEMREVRRTKKETVNLFRGGMDISKTSATLEIPGFVEDSIVVYPKTDFDSDGQKFNINYKVVGDVITVEANTSANFNVPVDISYDIIEYEAPFEVYGDGSFKATAGRFGGLEIKKKKFEWTGMSTNEEIDVIYLAGTKKSTGDSSYNSDIYIRSDGMVLTQGQNTISALNNGEVWVTSANSHSKSILTNSGLALYKNVEGAPVIMLTYEKLEKLLKLI